jgi:hypothetical protein
MGGSIFIYISRALRSDVQALKIDDSAIEEEVQLLTSAVKEEFQAQAAGGGLSAPRDA